MEVDGSSEVLKTKEQAAGQKARLDLLPPGALAPIAAAFAYGADKYGAWNWRCCRINASIYYAAALRHLFSARDGELYDHASGIKHVALAIANLMILLDAGECGTLNPESPPGKQAHPCWLVQDPDDD